MNLSVIAIVVGSAIALTLDLRSTKRSTNRFRSEASWPQFVETFLSAVSSGATLVEAMRFASDFKIKPINIAIEAAVATLDRGVRVESAFLEFGANVNHHYADYFVRAVLISYENGANNLIDTLAYHAADVREDLASREQTRARQAAILVVGKLGLLAPWVLLAVLCVNQANRTAFQTPGGQLLLLGGFAVSIIAYRLILLAGRLPSRLRLLIHG